jgi:two-component system LytT family response regulator
MINAIIIDDEQHCIDRLTTLLKNHARDIRLLGSYQDPAEGIQAILDHKPDLLFLDIQLRDITAFDLLGTLTQSHTPDIIFTTAHDKYAVQAFRYSAIDYLLKPIDPTQLAEAITKSRQSITAKDSDRKIDTLLHNLRNLQGANRRLCVPVVNGLVVLQVSDIIRCESDANYTTLFMRDKQKLTVAKTLREFEDLLTDANFYRVHNSHLVNLACIKSYNKGKGGFLTLIDNAQIEVSTRRKEDFLKRLSTL